VFTTRVSELRRQHAVFRRRGWFQGRPIHGTGISDIAWFKPDGAEMNDNDWQASYAKTIGVFLNGDALPWQDPRGHPVRSESFFLILNAHNEPIEFTVPAEEWGREWMAVLDTAHDDGRADDRRRKPGDRLWIADRSVLLLQRTNPSL
jgi:glycogen operon protein